MTKQNGIHPAIIQTEQYENQAYLIQKIVQLSKNSKEVNWNLAFATLTNDVTYYSIRREGKAWLIEAIKGNSIPLADVPESLLFSFLFNAHTSHFQTKGIFLYFFNNCNSIYTHGVWRYRTTGGRPEVV